MWIVKFKMGDEEHIIGSQDIKIEAEKYVEGYIAAIVNHTKIVSDEEIESLKNDFTIERVDNPKEE